MKTLVLILSLCPVVTLAQFENPAIVGAMTYSTAVAPPAWAPTNAYGWWHADSMLPTANGTLVTNWPDSSSTHNLFVYGATNIYAPYFTNSLINGRAGVKFTRTAPTALTNAFGATLNQPVTFFIVVNKPNILSSNPQNVFDGLPSHATQYLNKGSATTPNYEDAIGSPTEVVSPDACPQGWIVMTICFNSTASFVRTNGVLWFAGDSGANTATGITLGNNRLNTTSQGLNGWVTELIFYSGLPATNDMAWVESNLKAKYGL